MHIVHGLLLYIYAMQPAVLSDQPFIVCGQNLQQQLFDFLKSSSAHRLLVVVDSNTVRFLNDYKSVFDKFDKDFLSVEIPAGEEHKTLESAARIWNELIKQQFGKDTLLIALGGGMICDLTGFAASVYMRGIPFVFLPTSVLAMADASAGGKTGINLGDFKNIVGTFTEAKAVFMDFNFLKELPADEKRSGIAEILKHYLLLGKSPKQLTQKCLTDSVHEHIMETVVHKLTIVRQDFKEQNLREVLNLGHTVAHAIETLFLKQGKPLLHGYAVAAGLCIESFLAESFFSEGFDYQYHESIRQEIFTEFPRVELSHQDLDLLLSFMRSDKKNRIGSPSFSLIKGPACWQLQCRPTEELIRGALINYLNHA